MAKDNRPPQLSPVRTAPHEETAADTARSVMFVLDGTVRTAMAQAGQLTQWIFGSLFTLNMGGAAACVALDIGPLYRLGTAAFMMTGIFIVLAGGVMTTRKIIATTQELGQAMRYWVGVIEKQHRDREAEARIDEAFKVVMAQQRLGAFFMWSSFGAFLCGLATIFFGIAAR